MGRFPPPLLQTLQDLLESPEKRVEAVKVEGGGAIKRTWFKNGMLNKLVWSSHNFGLVHFVSAELERNELYLPDTTYLNYIDLKICTFT